MEENKYYVPEFSEFNDGLEYEALHSNEWFFCEGGNEWMKQIWHPQYRLKEQHPTTICWAIEKGWIRIPYLSKEDIEAEGFEVQPDNGQPIIYSSGKVEKRVLYKKDGLFLAKWDSSTAVVIILDNLDEEILFQGTIKNRSKLKDVLKMIGV